MKNSFLYLFMLVFAACSSKEHKGDDKGQDTTNKQPDTIIGRSDHAENLDTLDVSFFQQAAYGGMMEVESSAKILSVTESPDVKAFADMMVKDHGGANMKLKALAESKGYILPASLPESKVALIGKMDSFKDEGRNEYYLQLMMNEHKNAIDIFAVASRSKDEAINKFAKSLLPTLKHHYMEVRKVDSLFRQPKANQGDDPLKLSDRKKQ
ncbi:MAG: DUF4142 domain-containing protein [Pedobacter sp.]|nr:MAG: DUF4142 domain-containing protein [Pedobacter sp.]